MPRRTGRRGSWSLAALIAAAALAGCGGDKHADLLVTAPRLFDGERLIQDGAVAIRGEEIVAAGSREDGDVDAERTIALLNATLLPGLIDLHTHQLGYGQAGSAVTTVRDLGTDDRNLPLQGSPGPRVLAAGPLITAPGGYPIPIHGSGVAHVVRNPQVGRAYVRSRPLRAATSRAAKVLTIDGLGALAAGSPADLVAVRGDPMRDLAALAKPLLVVRAGVIQRGG